VAVERKYERDVDLLLAEEFSVNPEFARWFCLRTKFADHASEVSDVFVSKSNKLGESDLIVVFKTHEDSLVAVLIEDKVDAPLQPNQAARYRLRANQEVRLGAWTDYELVLCAPRFYLQTRADLADFDRLIPLEEIGAFLAKADPSTRGRYRGDFLATAATRRKNSWTREPDDATDAFWDAAYEIAVRDFPILELKPPKMTKDSNNFTLRPRWMPTQPKTTYVWIKGPLGVVDLTFGSTTALEFSEHISSLPLPDGITIHQTGASTAIRLKVPTFAISDGIEKGLPKVRKAFEASEELLRFYRTHQAVIDDAALRATPLE
jgi:hypothetical protein